MGSKVKGEIERSDFSQARGASKEWIWHLCHQQAVTCRLSGSVTESVVAVETVQKKFVMEVPWVRRSVRPSAVLFDVFRHLHRTGVPFCAWEGKRREGCILMVVGRIVTTARTVCDVLAGRSCNVLYFHRTRPNPRSVAASVTFVEE